LGAYTLVDLTFSNSTRFEHMTINAKINNLFNGGYAESVGYNPTTYAILEYPMPGRSFTVGLSFN
jgi:outer membrane receptor protein involved in Fe transport